jgi:hypothetical protein
MVSATSHAQAVNALNQAYYQLPPCRNSGS